MVRQIGHSEGAASEGAEAHGAWTNADLKAREARPAIVMKRVRWDSGHETPIQRTCALSPSTVVTGSWHVKFRQT